MSDIVCCPLSSSDDGGASCSRTSWPKARKAHVCGECGEDIVPGTQYEQCSGIWDGTPMRFRTCKSCVEIRSHFSCGEGWIYGSLWSDLRGNFFPTMAAGGPCMTGLSPENKQRLFDKRNEWLEDQLLKKERIRASLEL